MTLLPFHKAVTLAAGASLAFSTAVLPSSAVEVSTPAVTAASPSQNTSHQVSPTTKTAQKGSYLLKYKLNKDTGQIDVDLIVGQGYLLDCSSDGETLFVKNDKGATVERLDLPKVLTKSTGHQITGTPWATISSHEAKTSLSAETVAGNQAANPSPRNFTTLEVHAPSNAWYSCMADAGVSGATAGALSGCAASAEIGCIEGDLGGATIGALSNMAGALWSCRDKYSG